MAARSILFVLLAVSPLWAQTTLRLRYGGTAVLLPDYGDIQCDAGGGVGGGPG